MKPQLWAALGLLFFEGMPAALAEEPRLPPIDRASFEGEWEGAWSDRSGNLYVALISCRTGGTSTITIANSVKNPFLTTFTITEAVFQNGTVRIEAVGTGIDVGHRLALTGEGWAVRDVGHIRFAIEKRTDAGETLFKWDAVVYKAPGGFVESAAKLLHVSRLNGKAVPRLKGGKATSIQLKGNKRAQP
jgi:hypothetical protein